MKGPVMRGSFRTAEAGVGTVLTFHYKFMDGSREVRRCTTELSVHRAIRRGNRKDVDEMFVEGLN